jgi:hypothetical protein
MGGKTGRDMKRITGRPALFLAGLLAMATAGASAPQLEVTATDPAAAVDLPQDANVYARVHYRAEQPVRVQAVGMRDGAEVPGATNPSPAWEAGEGDVLAWIGFDAPASIDHLRVTLYDAQWQPLRHVDVPMAISWRADAPAHERAAWVKPLNDEQQRRSGEDMQALSSGTAASVVVDLVFTALPAYALLQVLLIVILRGRWRRRAMLPLLVMLGALLFSILALLAGSNLWPIWMILLAPLALVYLIVLALLYWLACRRGAVA